MKKHIVIIAVLLIFSIGATVVLGSEVNGTKNDVRISEKILFGDKSVANGIIVSEQAEYAEHLFWDVEYRIADQPESNTVYKFYSSKKNYDTIIYSGFNIGLRDGYGCDFSKPVEEQTGIAKAYKELYDDTAPGEEKSRTIRLIDYYDYYPVSLNADIPNLFWYGGGYAYNDEYLSEKAVCDRFSEFFKIPMLESETVSISVGKDIHGNLSMTGSGNAYSDEESESYDYYAPESCSAYTDNVCYFSFSNRTDKGNAIDTSMIEGGYGIYKINYTAGRYKDERGYFSTGIEADTLSTCFPLDEEYSVREMWLSDDGKTLYCILLDTVGSAVFIQINTETMECVTSFTLQSAESKYGIYVYPYEDFSAILIDDRITVLAPDGAGVYERRISVPITEYPAESLKWLYESAVMDYNGERLVIGGNLPEKRYLTYQTCDFYIAVYSASGLEFYAEYENSLSVNAYSGSYKANCHPVKIKVEWN